MDEKAIDRSTWIPSSPLERIANRPIFGIAVVVVLGLLAYSNTFHAPFVFDDEPSITDNPVIKDLGNFITNSKGYAYNPRRYVAYLTFAVNYHIGGLSVIGYHAFNIFVHLMNAFLVFTLVRLSFRTPFLRESGLAPSSGVIAFLSALFFAVHPVQTQAVTYIVQRVASLATFFSLASLCLYARWRINPESGRTLWNKSFPLYAFSLLCLVLAMRTKEIAFTIPLLIALYDRFFFKEMNLKFLVPVLLTLFILPVGMLNLGRPLGEVLSDVSAVTRVESELSRWGYLMTQCTVIITYLRLLVFPVNQNLDYDFPIAHSIFSGPVLLSAAALLSILSFGVALYRWSRPGRRGSSPECRLVSFGIAWFFTTLLVESSVIPITDVIFEHRIYLPSAGYFMALSVGLLAIGSRLETGIPGFRRIIVAAMVLAAIVLAGATFLRNETWKDDKRLWSDVIAKSPRKARPYYNLGLSYDLDGNLAEAMKNYITSLSLDPYSGKARDNLGTLFSKQGRFPEAIREFRTALALDPDDAAAHNNLGNVFAVTGRMEAALEEFRAALRSDPEYVEAYYNIGIAYGKMGDFERAQQAYSSALKLDPDHGGAHNNLGMLYARQGRLDDAATEFRAVVALDKSDAEAWNNLGIVYAHQGRHEEALRHFQEALQWSQGNAEVHHNTGMTYLALGRLPDAIREFQLALQINPAHAAARKNLADAQKRLSRNP